MKSVNVKPPESSDTEKDPPIRGTEDIAGSEVNDGLTVFNVPGAAQGTEQGAPVKR